jgi:GntR family transcriptional regulator/MocR family aminotransferase
MLMMIEITPLLNRHHGVSLYAEIYSYIKGEIESGSIVLNARLPSIRQLAQYLTVSKNTVEAAYQQLMLEGYVESRLRSGYYVLPVDEVSTVPPKILDTTNTPTVEKSLRFNFDYGDIEAERFPLRVWGNCLTDSLSEDPQHEVLGYGDKQGDCDLRSEIALYIYQSRGVACHPDQVIISSGTQQSIGLLCQLLQLRGEFIGIENPGYQRVRTVLRDQGCVLIPIALDQDGLSIEELNTSQVRAVYVTPSHQFPMGMILPIQKRNQLLRWAEDNDALIIEDDYDSEFRYVGQPIPALKALDSGDRVIYLGTFSKSFLPAARLSYMVLPSSIIVQIQDKLQSYNQSVSPIIQKAVYLFMHRGHFARHIRKMRRIYQSKHRALIRAIIQYMGVHVEVIGHKSGLHILLDVKGRDYRELIEQARLHSVQVYSPRDQWLDPQMCPASYVMLGFGGVHEEAMEEAVQLLYKAWFGSEN